MNAQHDEQLPVPMPEPAPRETAFARFPGEFIGILWVRDLWHESGVCMPASTRFLKDHGPYLTVDMAIPGTKLIELVRWAERQWLEHVERSGWASDPLYRKWAAPIEAERARLAADARRFRSRKKQRGGRRRARRAARAAVKT